MIKEEIDNKINKVMTDILGHGWNDRKGTRKKSEGCPGVMDEG